DDDLIFVNISDPFGLLPHIGVGIDGGPGTDIIGVQYAGLLNSVLTVIVRGNEGNDQIQVVCMIDSASTGQLGGAVLGGGGDDQLTFDVFFVQPDGSKIGTGHGKLTFLSALIDGGAGFDVCQRTGNVFVKNCEA